MSDTAENNNAMTEHNIVSSQNTALDLTLCEPAPLRKKQPKVKPRGDSKFSRMKPAQREKVLAWLFEDRLTCQEVANKCKAQFGVDISHVTVGKIFRNENMDRNVTRILQGSEFARKFAEQFGKNSEAAYQALLGVLAQLAFEAAMATEQGQKPNLGPLRHALPLLIEARREAREEREFQLERERWEFDAVHACSEHFKELQAIIENQSLDEPERLNALRKELFGKPQEQ